MSFGLFADDTTVYVRHDSIDGAIQISELAKVAEWFDSNKLTLNSDVNDVQKEKPEPPSMMSSFVKKQYKSNQGKILIGNR